MLKKITVAIICILINYSINAQNAEYNKLLADSLGSDANGMKMYILVILKTGKAKIKDKASVDSLFTGHMNNIVRLANLGKLIVAGPIKKNDKKYRGIFILNVPTITEAKALLLTDPAIKAKLLDTEIFEWYGSAALPLYLPLHNTLKK